MAQRNPRRQIVEERRDFGGHLRARIDFSHPRNILLAGLLGDLQPHLQMRLELGDSRSGTMSAMMLAP